MSEVKIKKIEIKIDKKTITLSLEQAKELKAALDDLFQQPATWYYPTYPCQHPYVSDYQWSYTAGDLKSDGTISLNIQGV